MPVAFPQFEPGGDSRPVLAEFVRAVRAFLDEIVETAEDYHRLPLFDAELLPLLREAWYEARPQFDRVAEATQGLTPEQVASHGLEGMQLRFKLAVIERANGRFRASGGIGFFKGVIEAIDTLLESILGALASAGIGSGIAEIKDYIGQSTRPIQA